MAALLIAIHGERERKRVLALLKADVSQGAHSVRKSTLFAHRTRRPILTVPTFQSACAAKLIKQAKLHVPGLCLAVWMHHFAGRTIIALFK